MEQSKEDLEAKAEKLLNRSLDKLLEKYEATSTEEIARKEAMKIVKASGLLKRIANLHSDQ